MYKVTGMQREPIKIPQNKSLIKAKVLTGKIVGEFIKILRIRLPSTNCPFEFTRSQFLLVKAYFAITVNKSQGQTICVTGIIIVLG